jgi:hypothetical protein
MTRIITIMMFLMVAVSLLLLLVSEYDIVFYLLPWRAAGHGTISEISI